MRKPPETAEERARLEAWLDRYTVTPAADLERLLSSLPPQEAALGARDRGRRGVTGATWRFWLDLWRPAALAALPVLLGFALSSAIPPGAGENWESSEQWVFAAGGEGYYP
jgi:hypothetical protein